MNEDIKNNLFAAQANMTQAISRAIMEYHEQTGIFIKGHFGFYILSGQYGDHAPTVKPSVQTQMTFDPEYYQLQTEKLK